MLEILPDSVAEGAVPVVHVANVIGEEIVRQIQIGPAVAIEILDHKVKCITLEDDSCRFRHVFEHRITAGTAAHIAIKAIGAFCISFFCRGGDIHIRSIKLLRVIDRNEKIQIAVTVIIKKCRLRGVRFVG